MVALTVKVRLYDFPSKRAHEVKTIGFDDEDVDGIMLLVKVSETLDLEPDCIDLFFRGKCIKPTEDLLSKTGFKSGSSIQVLHKSEEVQEIPQPEVDHQELQTAMAGLHLVMSNRHQKWKSRKYVTKLLTDPNKLRSIIDKVPGLKNDPVSLDILRHPDIFGHTVDPKNCERVLAVYRKVGAAIVIIWHDVSKAKQNASSNLSMSQDSWSLGDNEVEDMDSEQSGTPSTSRGSRNPAQSAQFGTPGGLITSNQLAQALTMANSPLPGRMYPSPIGSTNSSSLQSPQTGTSSTGGTGHAGSGGNAISPDVFSMAMQRAFTQASAAGGNSTPQQPDPNQLQQLSPAVIERGLEQLRGMGIGDEAASRQALMVANGNVETAVNILFSSGMDDM